MRYWPRIAVALSWILLLGSGEAAAILIIDDFETGDFTVSDDLNVYRSDYDGAGRMVRGTDSVLSNGFGGAAFDAPVRLAGVANSLASILE